MRSTIALAAFATALSPAPAQPVAGPAGAPMAAPVVAPMSTAQFRQMAMISDAFEIASSRLAMERSRSPAVRRFAAEMINDHSATSMALMGRTAPMAGRPVGGAAGGAVVGGLVAGPVGAAVGAGVGATAGAVDVTGSTRFAPGAMLDARHAAMLNQLASASGRQFDRFYGRMQVQAHGEAVGLYRAYAQAGTDPALRAFEQQALPHLEMHFAMARRLPR